MTSDDVVRRVVSAHNQFGDSNWALLQSGRQSECEPFEHLCDRVLAWLRGVDPAVAFQGLLSVFLNPDMIGNQDLAAELLLRGEIASTVPVGEFLDAVLRFDYPSSTDAVADYLAWAFGRAESLAAIHARLAAGGMHWYHLGFVEHALTLGGQEQPAPALAGDVASWLSQGVSGGINP